MRLYVIGANGQVARALREAAQRDDDIAFGFGARPGLDLLRPSSVEKAIAGFRPDLVVNPAAYTAVDQAESEPDSAFAINRDGARVVAAAAAAQGVPVIHLSTDNVFDGNKDGPYVESDAVNPPNVYGRSKLAGELAVAAANPRHIVLRTSWVYAPFGGNFLRTMLRLAAHNGRLRVVDDQRGCPTYAPDIAEAIIAMARNLAVSGWHSKFEGVTHLCGPDAVTRCAFARAIIEEAAARGGRSVAVDPISTLQYPAAAARPANACLSTARLGSIFDVRLPPLKHSLANCLDRLPRHEIGAAS
jgi:dTDP-4-dehydrorhamnose reductase